MLKDNFNTDFGSIDLSMRYSSKYNPPHFIVVTVPVNAFFTAFGSA